MSNDKLFYLIHIPNKEGHVYRFESRHPIQIGEQIILLSKIYKIVNIRYETVLDEIKNFQVTRRFIWVNLIGEVAQHE